jgi:uncharacterized membrane protein
MKKVSPLKLIRVVLAVALAIMIFDFFADNRIKQWTSIITFILLLFTFIYGMFKSGEIEAERIKKEKAN